MKKRKIISVILGIIFVILTIIVINNNSIDLPISNKIIQLRTNEITNIILFITKLGDATTLIFITITILFLSKNKKVSLTIIINLILIFLLSQIFKIIIQRPRPNVTRLIKASGYSYPSGHATVSLSYYTFLAYILAKSKKSKLFKYLTYIFSSTIIILIGFTRIYLGVHYLTDILAGYILSTIYLISYIKILKNYKGDVL